MNRRNFIRTAAGTIAIATIAGCSDSSANGSGGEDGPIVIRSHRLTRGQYGNVSVTGLAENVSNRSIGYAQIEANFYNGRTRIGSGMANINNLGAGRRWEFDAMYMGMDGDRVTDYELYVSP